MRLKTWATVCSIEMKVIEIMGGLRLPVFNQEMEIYHLIEEKKLVKRSQLNERQQELARTMVKRGILRQFTKDGKLCFVINRPEPLGGMKW